MLYVILGLILVLIALYLHQVGKRVNMVDAAKQRQADVVARLEANSIDKATEEMENLNE